MPSRKSWGLAAVTALLLLAPAAEAASKPAAYFLRDGADAVSAPDPPVPPLPVPLPLGVPQVILAGDAVLDPYNSTLGNLPNGTRPHTRVLLPAADAVAPLEFVTPADHEHPDRLRGYILMALFPGQSAVPHGNLTATLYEVPASGSRVALANASIVLDTNASKLPNATALMPPNSTDPTVILYYELAQVLPVLTTPAAYFLFGPVDLNVSNGSRIALDVRLTQGSSPGPAPVGASATLQYESLYTPSFVVLPWYTPDPPRTTVTRTSTPGGFGGQSSSASSSGPDAGSDDGGDGKDTPGVSAALLAGLLAAMAVALRRRLR